MYQSCKQKPFVKIIKFYSHTLKSVVKLENIMIWKNKRENEYENELIVQMCHSTCKKRCILQTLSSGSWQQLQAAIYKQCLLCVRRPFMIHLIPIFYFYFNSLNFWGQQRKSIQLLMACLESPKTVSISHINTSVCELPLLHNKIHSQKPSISNTFPP